MKSQTSKMAEKAKTVALDESRRLQALTTQAAKSGAYFYPIRVCDYHDYIVYIRLTLLLQGLFYFAMHRSLWYVHYPTTRAQQPAMAL